VLIYNLKYTSANYQSQIDEEAGVFTGFRQVWQKDSDAQHKDEEILTYLTQCLNTHQHNREDIIIITTNY